jgi:hypothetical protein
LLPPAGLTVEYAASGLQGLHQDDYSWGRLFLFSAGNDFYLGPVSVGPNVQQPVRQQVADGNVKAGTRLTTQVFFLFDRISILIYQPQNHEILRNTENL